VSTSGIFSLQHRGTAAHTTLSSVRIDVDQLLRDREAERLQIEALEERAEPTKARSSRKRKVESTEDAPKPKKQRTKPAKPDVSQRIPTPASVTVTPTPAIAIAPKVTLRLGPQPKEPDVFPCCLCVSTSREGLLRVQDPPLWRKEGESGGSSTEGAIWMAHEYCANVVPETWVDDVEVGPVRFDGTRATERVILGVDGIVKDRWNLVSPQCVAVSGRKLTGRIQKCNACSKPRHKAHGAPIQCTKGRCPKAFHVSCARDGGNQNIIYHVVKEIQKDVLLFDPTVSASMPVPGGSVPEPMTIGQNGEPSVVKRIKKVEVELLCPQHNPVRIC
jgi:hypothetical protein